MNTCEILADQLRLAAEGGAWHGPSVREALDGVTAVTASAHPIPGAHSIWELVRHLHGAYQLVLRRVNGIESPFLPDEDWPPLPPPTEENWQRDVAELLAENRRLEKIVRTYDPQRLFERIVPSSPYTAFTQFIGLTQHNLYHAGQIVLLRRALGAT